MIDCVIEQRLLAIINIATIKYVRRQTFPSYSKEIEMGTNRAYQRIMRSTTISMPGIKYKERFSVKKFKSCGNTSSISNSAIVYSPTRRN